MADTAVHLARSHAKEGEIPGTVNLQAQEGDDLAYGQALFPVPSTDPNDPLQWQQWKKTAILVLVSLYSFFSNTALLGPSTYIGIYAQEFGISPTKASGLISYPNILYGCGTLITVPMYLKFGRRPIMLLSLVVYVASLIGCSRSTSYGGLMAGRVFASLASGVCEALPVQLVNDIFFLHERATKLGIYTVCLSLGATGPLYAGYMLAAGYSWRLYFYVQVAFGGLLLVMSFFFVEETAYKRESTSLPLELPDEIKSDVQAQHIEAQMPAAIPARRSFVSTLKFWGTTDHEIEFWWTALRSFTYFLVPSVVWVVATYGIYIGLGALVFNYTFPLLITVPPYNWEAQHSGLVSLGNVVGFALAIPLLYTFDKLAAYLTKRNNDIREAEMRLGVLLPGMVIAPAGMIVYGLTAQYRLHWIGYFFGVAMCNWGAYFYFTGTLAYAVDSYSANVSEMLIAMCCGKQLISFAFGIYLLDWVEQSGYAVIIAGVFCGVLLINNLFVIVFMLFGKTIRRTWANTWLARLHKKSIKQVMSH